jgi:hypothetical protein
MPPSFLSLIHRLPHHIHSPLLSRISLTGSSSYSIAYRYRNINSMMMTRARYPQSLAILLAACCVASAESWAFSTAWKKHRQGITFSSSATTPQTSNTALLSATIDTQGDQTESKPLQSQPPNKQTRILADAADFIKPERDLRQYRRIVLPNNLQCLLVSNSNSDTSTEDSDEDDNDGDDDNSDGKVGIEAAAVHVQAGHMDDSLPGLAHFNEQ